ncbi:YigZ family protein [[Mycoplasma] gypis]|uniref:YigZ family protein n=1 Tax=[Mycoplasma] gypis TaxID=92404 RepID=A0ABZ2RMP7_9BACT|nr:YigZ family protein [[Mycoplasma] gypis]MBN0919050.1 YigZ family protein [[Mycoplasma] gypis]
MKEIEIKKSRFIAIKYNVKSENEVQQIYLQLKKEHKRSRHVCYAYRIFDNGRWYEKGFDDGEPKNTAGLPLLTLLRNKEAQNIAVFVIRYFGGILLGRSKLPGAYIKSAKLELD